MRKIHFTDKYLLSPYHPVTVLVAGAGGHCHGSKHRPPAVQRDGTGVEQGDGACHPRQPFFRLRVGGQGIPLSDHNQRRG